MLNSKLIIVTVVLLISPPTPVQCFLERANCLFICCLQRVDRRAGACTPPAEAELQDWGRVECFGQHCLVAAKWYDNEWPRAVSIDEDHVATQRLNVFEEEEETRLCPEDYYWDTLNRGRGGEAVQRKSKSRILEDLQETMSSKKSKRNAGPDQRRPRRVKLKKSGSRPGLSINTDNVAEHEDSDKVQWRKKRKSNGDLLDTVNPTRFLSGKSPNNATIVDFNRIGTDLIKDHKEDKDMFDREVTKARDMFNATPYDVSFKINNIDFFDGESTKLDLTIEMTWWDHGLALCDCFGNATTNVIDVSGDVEKWIYLLDLEWRNSDTDGIERLTDFRSEERSVIKMTPGTTFTTVTWTVDVLVGTRCFGNDTFFPYERRFCFFLFNSYSYAEFAVHLLSRTNVDVGSILNTRYNEFVVAVDTVRDALVFEAGERYSVTGFKLIGERDASYTIEMVQTAMFAVVTFSLCSLVIPSVGALSEGFGQVDRMAVFGGVLIAVIYGLQWVDRVAPPDAVAFRGYVFRCLVFCIIPMAHTIVMAVLMKILNYSVPVKKLLDAITLVVAWFYFGTFYMDYWRIREIDAFENLCYQWRNNFDIY